MSGSAKEGISTIIGDNTIISFEQDFGDNVEATETCINIIRNMININKHLFFKIDDFNLRMQSVPGNEEAGKRPIISYKVTIPSAYHVISNLLINNPNNKNILNEITNENYTNLLLENSIIGKFYKHENDKNIKLVPTIYYLLGKGKEYWEEKSPLKKRRFGTMFSLSKERNTENITYTDKKFIANEDTSNAKPMKEPTSENVAGGRKKTKKRKSKKSKRRRKSKKAVRSHDGRPVNKLATRVSKLRAGQFPRRRTKRRRSKNRK